MHSEVAVQNTYQEWIDSGSKASCQDCHMGSKGHRFPGGHDAAFLQNSLAVKVVATENKMNVTIQTMGVGHAFPTGDAFRRLQWRMCADENCSIILRQKSFAIVHGGPSWHVVKDGLLYPNQPKKITLPRPENKSYWQLLYFYGDPSVEQGLPESEIFTMIQHGVIEPH